MDLQFYSPICRHGVEHNHKGNLTFLYSDWATDCTTEESWFDSEHEEGTFVYSVTFQPILWLTQPPVRRESETVCSVDKAAGTWSWPFTSLEYQRWECKDVYGYSLFIVHAVVLKSAKDNFLSPW
jgi:hypothetical protein